VVADGDLTDGPAVVGDDADLVAVIADAQRLGMLGDRPPAEVIEHSRRFVSALTPVVGSVVDIGSGGGVPGLVIAHDRPDLLVTLIDRRERRTDFLSLATRRLAMTDRVMVRCEDLDESARALAGRFDAVTARSAGPPDRVLRWAAALRTSDGLIVISDPPAPAGAHRWNDEPLATTVRRFGLHRSATPGISVFSGA
jgi:16S rRNA (guanine527-N7)-methyltransferase